MTADDRTASERRGKGRGEPADATAVGAGRRIQLGPDEVVLEDFETHRAILAGLASSKSELSPSEESLRELRSLAATVGAATVSTHLQVRDAPDPATYVGSGKVAEIAREALAHDATLIVFDDELSPAQLRNLEEAFGGRRVLDRTQLILDIFAANATTREGRVQVEVAQLRYRLPRLRGRGAYLSRLGGGIGTRGPGETVLEVDRRRIQERLARLGRELESLDRTRRTQRKGRRRGSRPVVALVGYTNAGKSTILNALSGSDTLVRNRLFSTLDTTVRRVSLPGGRTILVGDTVGFVRKLPHELVRAFHSTLEEIAEADLVVQVVDASTADPFEHLRVVRSVLHDIGASGLPSLVVWNKADRVDATVMKRLLDREDGSVATAAAEGDGMDELVVGISDALDRNSRLVEMFVPYARGDVLSGLHADAEVVDESALETGVQVTARVRPDAAARYAQFLTGGESGD